MDQTATTKKLAKKYRFLIWFPSTKIVLLSYFTTMLILAIAILYITDMLKVDFYIFFFTNFLLPLALLVSSPIINTRRSLGPIPFFNILLLLSLILSSLILQNPATIYLFSSIIGLTYITCRIFDKKGHGIFLLLSAILLPALLTRDLLLVTAVGLSSVLLSEILLQYNTRLEAKILGKKYHVFDAFLDYILADNPSMLENILNEVSGKTEKLFIYTLSFTNSTNILRGILIIPFIHPGPFRDFGSSTLPSDLMRKFRSLGIPALVFHGASSHERDLIFKSDTKKIVEEIVTAATKKNNNYFVKFSNFHRKASENFTSFSLKINNHFLTFISSNSKGLEDIPYEIMLDIHRKIPCKPIIVDSHNRLDPKGENPRPLPSTSYYHEIIDLVVDAYKSMESPKYDIVKAGFYSMEINDYSKESGIGAGGIAGVVVEIAGEKYFLLTLDGNNLVNPYRDIILKTILNEYDLKDGEITTTDTHTVAGITPVKEYSPLGEKISVDKLVKYAIEVVKKAYNNMTLCRVKISKYEYELPVFGYNCLNKISVLASKSIMAFVAFMILILFTGFLLSLAIAI
ncbi:MAG: hypothetical protein DRZ80_00495 [Thermoprotei archaeon]|nr:MAG: hypothetical protein DRZ80_00495 [Thermoprotei archaeon]